MNAPPILIVSSQLSSDDLCRPPFGLDPEFFRVVSLESLNWLGISSYAAVILHDPPAELLHELALGLRDSPSLESLWELLKTPGKPVVRVLTPAPCRPPKSWIDLGLEPILPHEIIKLTASHTISSDATDEVDSSQNYTSQALTADDIRQLHKNGVRVLPPDRPLTDWAREVAAQLGLSEANSGNSLILYYVRAVTRNDLMSVRDKLFNHSIAFPQLLFILPPPMIPLFQELFPSLRGRVVASSVHWASHGAFTGETSLNMLADLGCRGAILPSTKPYCDPDHLKSLAELAKKCGLSIFTTLPLEWLSECGIMLSQFSDNSKFSGVFIHLIIRPDGKMAINGTASKIARPPTARLVDDQQLAELLQGKGKGE